MKTIAALLLASMSLSALAQDYRFMVLTHKDENNKNTIVKVRITKKMVEQRKKPGIGIACYTTLNPTFLYRMISGDYFWIGKGNNADEGKVAAIASFKGLDSVRAMNWLKTQNGEQVFMIESEREYTSYQSLPSNSDLPHIDDVPEVAPSKLSAQVHVNTFACAFIGRNGPIDP